MGSGYYLQSSHPPALAAMSVDAIADEIVAEALDGIDGVRIGLIGEIGVSGDFTPDEEKVAARRRARAGAHRAAADGPPARAGTGSGCGSSTSSRRKAAIRATPCSAT